MRTAMGIAQLENSMGISMWEVQLKVETNILTVGLKFVNADL
jgi:hypothetical protein